MTTLTTLTQYLEEHLHDGVVLQPLPGDVRAATVPEDIREGAVLFYTLVRAGVSSVVQLRVQDVNAGNGRVYVSVAGAPQFDGPHVFTDTAHLAQLAGTGGLLTPLAPPPVGHATYFHDNKGTIYRVASSVRDFGEPKVQEAVLPLDLHVGARLLYPVIILRSRDDDWNWDSYTYVEMEVSSLKGDDVIVHVLGGPPVPVYISLAKILHARRYMSPMYVRGDPRSAIRKGFMEALGRVVAAPGRVRVVGADGRVSMVPLAAELLERVPSAPWVILEAAARATGATSGTLAYKTHPVADLGGDGEDAHVVRGLGLEKLEDDLELLTPNDVLQWFDVTLRPPAVRFSEFRASRDLWAHLCDLPLGVTRQVAETELHAVLVPDTILYWVAIRTSLHDDVPRVLRLRVSSVSDDRRLVRMQVLSCGDPGSDVPHGPLLVTRMETLRVDADSGMLRVRRTL